MTAAERTFLTAWLAASLLTGWLLWQSADVLMGEGSVDEIHAVYHSRADVLTFGVPGLSVFLLMAAVYLEWKVRRIRYFVFAGLFYMIFTIVDYMVVAEMYFAWLRNTGQWKGGVSGFWVFGIVLVFTGMIVTAAALWLTRTIREILQK